MLLLTLTKCLNPYSTGSNSNEMMSTNVDLTSLVLILILLEVTQIQGVRTRFSYQTIMS